MSKEVMKQAIITEAEIQMSNHPSKDARWFAKSVYEYLLSEQPAQQDTVAWAKHTEKKLRFTTMPMNYEDGWRPLVFGDTSTPASKPWVGLTDEEVLGLFGKFSAMTGKGWLALYRITEAKLKEKNNG